MASGIDVTALTLNAKENPDFGTFVNERIFEQPMLTKLHRVWQGVTMNEQIVFASLFGKTGISDAACARPTSGAKSTLTQKNTTPKGIGDTLVHCNSEVNSLFKAYFDKINKFEELYDIQGSDLEKFLMALFSDSASKSVLRYAWLGDTAVAAAGAGSAGLVSAGDVKFYNVIDGIWKQLFAGVVAADVKRYELTINAEVTTVAQDALVAAEAINMFEGMWALADPRLRADPSKQFQVTHLLFENYRKYLQGKGENFTIDYTLNGLPSLKWNGVDVIDMETVWDLDLRADFVDNTTNNAYYLPNRAVLTVPDNIPVTTLNDGDMDELKAWYNEDDRVNKMAYGFTLDALYLEGYMVVVAY